MRQMPLSAPDSTNTSLAEVKSTSSPWTASWRRWGWTNRQQDVTPLPRRRPSLQPAQRAKPVPPDCRNQSPSRLSASPTAATCRLPARLAARYPSRPAVTDGGEGKVEDAQVPHASGSLQVQPRHQLSACETLRVGDGLLTCPCCGGRRRDQHDLVESSFLNLGEIRLDVGLARLDLHGDALSGLLREQVRITVNSFVKNNDVQSRRGWPRRDGLVFCRQSYMRL